MKARHFETWDYRIMENVKNKARVIGYVNFLEWFEVKKYKDIYTLFLSVNPDKLKLTDVGYDDKWSKKRKNNKVIEQFEVKMNMKQLKELYDAIGKRFAKK